MTDGGVGRMWGGRFREELAGELDRLNRSLPVDRRIWRQDVAVSVAWVGALGGAGVLSAEEADTLQAGLAGVRDRLAGWSDGDWGSAADEDVHTLVERLLAEAVGPVAGKLATGRSRNDQVATGTRLWALEAATSVDKQLRELQRVLIDQAEHHVDTVMPSYTHLQRAQPVSAGHWLLSHFWPLARDRDRLSDASKRLRVMPLGSGAVAGCPYPVDRERLAAELGFDTPSSSSMDGVADRDFVAELLFVAAMVGSHLSRLAEDVIVFSTSEFGFIRLPDRYSTGSSLMPQKRNPDAMELARGKAGRLTAELAGWLVTLKGLPSGYNKDLQDDKAALFAAMDTLTVLLPAVAGTIREMSLDPRRCAAAMDEGMVATDLADALVAEGVPFREAHAHAGKLVRLADELGCAMVDVPREQVLAISPAFGAVDLAEALDPRRSLGRRAAYGGTAPEAVRVQLAEAAALL